MYVPTRGNNNKLPEIVPSRENLQLLPLTEDVIANLDRQILEDKLIQYHQHYNSRSARNSRIENSLVKGKV